MRTFVRVGTVEEFREGRGTAVTVHDKLVAVFKIQGRIYAITDACPHMGASLADGKLNGHKVICHWHEWEFDLTSGRTTEREWACANVYEVKLEGDEVYLRPPEPPPVEEREEQPWVVFDPNKHFKKKGK